MADTSSTTDDSGYVSQRQIWSSSGDINAIGFVIERFLARVRTASLVKVLSCTRAGELAPVGRVDLQPLVNQLDGALKAVPHAPVHDVPYLRVQGGTDAVIIDPKPGDIGIAVFADRDISAVKASGEQSAPGSGRVFDLADALYLGGVLNGQPQQFVRFSGEGIEIVSPTKIRLNAPNIEIEAGDAITTKSGSLTHNGTNIGDSHVHGGVSSGGSDTAGPH